MKEKKKRDARERDFAAIMILPLATTLLFLLFVALAGAGCTQPQTEGDKRIVPSPAPTPTSGSAGIPVSVNVEPKVLATEPADVYVLRVGSSTVSMTWITSLEVSMSVLVQIFLFTASFLSLFARGIPSSGLRSCPGPQT
jgi:hypothetical protein